jgi:glycine/serine hydroxymethyltransferase
MKEAEMRIIGDAIYDCLIEKQTEKARASVQELCERFPIYEGM